MVGGQIYLRARHDDIHLVSASPRPFGAAIFYWRYLAEYPEGHSRHGQSTTELLDALRAARVPYVADPNTPALACSGILKEEGARLRASSMVDALERLPLQPRELANRRRRDAFVDDTMKLQVGASAVVAPYLEYKHRGDEVLRINIAMLRRVKTVAAGQLPAAFIQVTASELRRGLVAQLAPWYVKTEVTRVFLRVRCLDAEKADAREFNKLLDAIDAFSRLEVELIPDCVGRLGPPLVAGGAPSFSSGPVYFRKVPAALLNKNGGGGLPVAYEVAGGFRNVDRSERRGGPHCFEPNCAADSPDATLDDLRLHDMHVLREESRLAATNGAAWYARRLIESGQPEAVVWGGVLRERAARAA